jgi:hypothetical protein
VSSVVKATNEDLLGVLFELTADGRWVEAESVRRTIHGIPLAGTPSAISIGARLARLARQGKCEQDASGAISLYRAKAAGTLPVVYVVEDDTSRGERHIPNASLGGGEAITLCGYVDVTYREEFGQSPDCADCLKIVRYCRGLDL